mgnify:CR=1 FL=1|jgi:hypothetical protein
MKILNAKRRKDQNDFPSFLVYRNHDFTKRKNIFLSFFEL